MINIIALIFLSFVVWITCFIVGWEIGIAFGDWKKSRLPAKAIEPSREVFLFDVDPAWPEEVTDWLNASLDDYALKSTAPSIIFMNDDDAMLFKMRFEGTARMRWEGVE